MRARLVRLVPLAGLLLLGMIVGTGCFGLPGGGGGTINPNEPRFISGDFVSGQGKVVSFAQDGSYKLFASAEKQASQEATIASKYEVNGNDISFEREDGSKFGSVGKLAEDGNSFTWEEHPGETFTKKTE